MSKRGNRNRWGSGVRQGYRPNAATPPRDVGPEIEIDCNALRPNEFNVRSGRDAPVMTESEQLAAWPFRAQQLQLVPISEQPMITSEFDFSNAEIRVAATLSPETIAQAQRDGTRLSPEDARRLLDRFRSAYPDIAQYRELMRERAERELPSLSAIVQGPRLPGRATARRAYTGMVWDGEAFNRDNMGLALFGDRYSPDPGRRLMANQGRSSRMPELRESRNYMVQAAAADMLQIGVDPAREADQTAYAEFTDQQWRNIALLSSGTMTTAATTAEMPQRSAEELRAAMYEVRQELARTHAMSIENVRQTLATLGAAYAFGGVSADAIAELLRAEPLIPKKEPHPDAGKELPRVRMRRSVAGVEVKLIRDELGGIDAKAELPSRIEHRTVFTTRRSKK